MINRDIRHAMVLQRRVRGMHRLGGFGVLGGLFRHGSGLARGYGVVVLGIPPFSPRAIIHQHILLAE